MSTEPQEPPGAGEPPAAAQVHLHTDGVRPRGRRRPAQWRMIFVTGLFAATVYAATEGLLRMAVDAPVPAAREAPARGPGPAARGSSRRPATRMAPTTRTTPHTTA